MVLMSAMKKGSQVNAKDQSKAVHEFEQKIPMPSYLLAIVVGALESRSVF